MEPQAVDGAHLLGEWVGVSIRKHVVKKCL